MISAVILAAGQSRRMGRPKINLPWGPTTVIGQVIASLLEAGVEDVVAVTGKVQIQGINLKVFPSVHCVYNPLAESGEMLSSLQVGLANLPAECQAVLIALGDQPQMESQVVKKILEAYHKDQPKIIIPSYQMRRGHPWLISKALWPEVLAMSAPKTLRDLVHQHSGEIHYLNIESPSVLMDLDTPQDYEKYRPKL